MENLLAMPGVPLTVTFHTYDATQTPPAPAAIDSDYNAASGLPAIKILQDDSDVTSGWTVGTPTGPSLDTISATIANRYSVQLTPPSNASGVFQVVAAAQVNTYEGACVVATMQVGSVPLGATAPDGWIIAATIAVNALAGTGDWITLADVLSVQLSAGPPNASIKTVLAYAGLYNGQPSFGTFGGISRGVRWSATNNRYEITDGLLVYDGFSVALFGAYTGNTNTIVSPGGSLLDSTQIAQRVATALPVAAPGTAGGLPVLDGDGALPETVLANLPPAVNVSTSNSFEVDRPPRRPCRRRIVAQDTQTLPGGISTTDTFET